MAMKSQKPNLRARKPLSDCTNTVLSSQSSNFSDAIKPRKRVIKSVVKEVVNNEKKGESRFASASTSVNLQANPSFVFLPVKPSSNFPLAEPNPSSDSIPTEPSSSSFPIEASTTPLRRTDLPSCSGTDRVSEPKSFYSRRNPTNKRKSVEITDAPFVFSTASKVETRVEKRDGYSSPSKAKTVPYRKRQRSSIYGEDECEFDLPRGFVEQQRAYFSEVDAFELPMEEAKSSDSE